MDDLQEAMKKAKEAADAALAARKNAIEHPNTEPQAHSEFAPSSLARLEKCPASWLVCKDAPGSPETEASKRGTELHAEMARLISCKQDKPSCDETRAAFEFFWKNRRGNDLKTESEVRVAYRSFSGELYFGTADAVITRANGDLFLIDWKFGGKPVAAPGNPQLAAYAVALSQERHPGRIDAAIFQPAVDDEVPAIWSDIDIEAQRERVIGIIARAQEATRNDVKPGECQCQYCPAWAGAFCPAILTSAEAIGNAVSRKSNPLTAIGLANMDDAKLSAWMDAGELAEQFLEFVRIEVRRRAKTNGSCGGWTIKKAKGRLTVTDPQGLFEELHEMFPTYVSPEKFLEAVTVSAPKVTTVLVGMTGNRDAKKELKATAAELCEKYGTRGEDTERLVRE